MGKLFREESVGLTFYPKIILFNNKNEIHDAHVSLPTEEFAVNRR